MDFYTRKIKVYSSFLSKLSVKKIKLFRKKTKKRELEKIFVNQLLGSEPTQLTGAKLDREDNLIVNKLFRPFYEIANSYESIQNIPIYIGVFPFQEKQVSKVSYIRYNIENYLQELYILRLRLLVYLTTIERAYKKSRISEKVSKKATNLKNLVEKMFENYIKVRGSHVHVARYADSDVDRLSLFEVLTKSSDDEFVKNIKLGRELVFREVRKKWKRKIKNDSKEIHKFLEVYFDTIHEVITENNKLVYPWE